MAGFYGNISTSNKTVFSFDRIYNSRWQMEQSCDTDDIFLNRYVLVEYDDPPLVGYLVVRLEQTPQGELYVQHWYADGASQTELQVDITKIYQNLTDINTDHSFYRYEIRKNENDADVLQWWPIDGASSPYAASYNQDVRYYGRGYDSTVWMKTMDSVTHKQKYVMIAELNTVVPNFYLVSDPPTATPLAPYFDNQSTKLDYYLHMPSTWGTRIQNVALGSDYASLRDAARHLIESVPAGTAPAIDSTLSDEKITYYESSWSESTRSWTRQPALNNVDGDIYFNLAGFSPLTNTIDNSTVNSVNYSFGSSGNLYDIGGNRVAAVDQMLWHIRLPAIGNTIARVWNTLYTEGRKVAFLDENYNNEQYCTIGTQSVLGVINNAQEIVGGIYAVNGAADFANAAATSSSIITADGQISETLYNIMKARNKSFVSRTVDDTQYYYLPTYAAIFTQVDRNEITNQDVVYKLDADGIYRKTHKDLEDIATTLYSRQEENETKHFPYIRFKKVTEREVEGATPYSGSALRIANEELNGVPTTLMGAIAYTNKLLGTQLDLENSRDERTVIGLMNRMRDMINNIDTHLVPNRLVYVSNTGKLVTSNYVYTEPITNKVLIGASGAVNWVDSSTLPLGTYTSQNVQPNPILSSDNIGGALAKLETRISAEESTRSNAVSTINSNLETAIAQEGRDRTAAINSATLAITGLSQQPAEGAIAQYVTNAIAAAEQRINAATQSAINDAFEGDEVDINETFVRSVIGTELTDAQPNADPPVYAGLIMSAINTKVNAEATARDSAISARFNAELDENGSSNNLIHILQGYVDSETTARETADNTLSGRITTLENSNSTLSQTIATAISAECNTNGIIDNAINTALGNWSGTGTSGELTPQQIQNIVDTRIQAACGNSGSINSYVTSALNDYLLSADANTTYELKNTCLKKADADTYYQAKETPGNSYATTSTVNTAISTALANNSNPYITQSDLTAYSYDKEAIGDLASYIKTDTFIDQETDQSYLLEEILDDSSTGYAKKSDLSTTNGNVSTNTGNIATNTGNIATNTTNISANSGNITQLQGLINDLIARVAALEAAQNPGE